MTSTVRLTLRQFVAASMSDTVTDFHAEAERLVAQMPPEDRDVYLMQALVGVINDLVGQRRRSAFDALTYETTNTGTSHMRGENQTCTAGSGVGPSRVSQLKNHWNDLLNAVGLSADGGRKRVGDMTYADLDVNIAHREKLARYPSQATKRKKSSGTASGKLVLKKARSSNPSALTMPSKPWP